MGFFKGSFPFHQRMHFKHEQVDVGTSLEEHFSHRCGVSTEERIERGKILK